MSNRDFLNAVLIAMRRGGAWVSCQAPTAEIEAVRRRFGRWAHAGVFGALADALRDFALSPECRRLLSLAAELDRVGLPRERLTWVEFDLSRASDRPIFAAARLLASGQILG